MANAHYPYNDQTRYGRQLRSLVSKLDEHTQERGKTIEKMAAMIDGDGTAAAHFATVTSEYGFADNATAKAAYDELVLLDAKLTTNASVTDVKNQIRAVIKKLG